MVLVLTTIITEGVLLMNKKALLGLALGATTLTTSACRHCGFFHSMDSEFARMQQELDNMRNVFRQMEQEFAKSNAQAWRISRPKNNVQIEQKEDKTVVSIKLGADIKNFDANLKTKKKGHRHDQMIITTKEPRKQKAIIKVNGNMIAVYQKSEASNNKIHPEPIEGAEEKKDEENKQEKPVFYGAEESSYMMTVDYKLNLQDADVSYDSKEGMLTVEIPAIKPEQKGQKVEVKIK